MIAVFLADGFEEIEALVTVDFLRRAGLDVRTVAVGGLEVGAAAGQTKSGAVRGAHDIPVLCDLPSPKALPLEQLKALVLPGGMPGTTNLEGSRLVQSVIEYASQNGLLIAAICAAPSILAHLHLLQGKRATCFPGFEDELRKGGALAAGAYLAEDGELITARGAGCTIDFAQAIAARFVGKDRAREIRETMQTPYKLSI
jgi:4-methyl-5(b-hydroxyethyl)-thiazole monophosphate biosynthesis